MFCARCGAKISISNQFCTNCGAKNENYNEKKKTKLIMSIRQKQLKDEHMNDADKESVKGGGVKKIVLPVVIITVLAVFAVVGISMLRYGKTSISDNNQYEKKGADGYISADGNAVFLTDRDVVRFSGDFKQAYTTPDYSKYVLLNQSGELLVYTEPSAEPNKIAENADEISAVNNQGVFVYDISSKHLKFYFFGSSEPVDTGFDKDWLIQYSDNKMSVAGVDPSGEVCVYTAGNENVGKLCKVEDDIKICAVSDSGDNVIWTIEKDRDICVYMMRNGVPERIGKLGKTESYYYVQGHFFDAGKSFIVYMSGGSQMILSVNGENPKEISIGTFKNYGNMVVQNGRVIFSEASKVDYFYFVAINDTNNTTANMYKLDLDGSLTEVAADINLSEDESYKVSEKCRVVDGNIFYLGKDGDLFVKKTDESDSVRITTDVDEMSVSIGGKYIYLVKSGTLYCCDLSDKEYKLSAITTGFSDRGDIYMTDSDDVIYYKEDNTDIMYTEGSKTKDTYSNKGTLKKYTVGGESTQISDDVLIVWKNDSDMISSKQPVIYKYIAMDGADIIAEIGTITDGSYSAILENYKW